MKAMKSLIPYLIAILSMMAMLPQTASAAGGAYASSVVAPTIYSKNWPYQANFPIVGTPPSTGNITTVYWTWSFSYRPVGLNVYLCQGSTSACWNVTNIQSGSTTAFQGRNPTSPFFLYYWVAGTGTMSPAYGNSDQVIVNWQ